MTFDEIVPALSELIELCRSGNFYYDHDESMRVLGRADVALSALIAQNGEGLRNNAL